jgi:hypothetical protein
VGNLDAHLLTHLTRDAGLCEGSPWTVAGGGIDVIREHWWWRDLGHHRGWKDLARGGRHRGHRARSLPRGRGLFRRGRQPRADHRCAWSGDMRRSSDRVAQGNAAARRQRCSQHDTQPTKQDPHEGKEPPGQHLSRSAIRRLSFLNFQRTRAFSHPPHLPIVHLGPLGRATRATHQGLPQRIFRRDQVRSLSPSWLAEATPLATEEDLPEAANLPGAEDSHLGAPGAKRSIGR